MTSSHVPFKLSENFVQKYSKIKPLFGFNGLGEFVFRRTYSRLKSDNTNEEWFETIQRVVNGTYNTQKKWIEQYSLGWNAWQAQKSAQEMYDRIFYMKFLPPGRGLWAMGSPIIEEKGLWAAANNCGFVSTINLKDDPISPFTFLMDASMLGVGVGFDTKGEQSFAIKGPNKSRNTDTFLIPDSREGWVESLKLLLESYFHGTAHIIFDYSSIRKAGEPIKGFGGISSGKQPLIELHDSIRKILDKEIGQLISMTAIVDLMNLIGKCVVSGNIRRSSELVLGNPYDDDYLDLKNYAINPQRQEFGWSSNNSILAELGMDYTKVANQTKTNGEPGYVWLENIRAFSRMDGTLDYKDKDAVGCNPCLSGDTLIAVADGRNAVSIKQLAEEGLDIPVYSVDENKCIIVKMGRNPRMTRQNQQLYKITLDDGSVIRATNNHEFMLITGEMKRLDALKPNDRLLVRYKWESTLFSKERSGVYHFLNRVGEQGNVRTEHKILSEFYFEQKIDNKLEVVHHKNHNGLDNSKENLEIMTIVGRNKLHSDSIKGDNNPTRKYTLEKKQEISKKLSAINTGNGNGMFGKHHKEDSKLKIGLNTLEHCKDPEYRQKLAASIKEGMKEKGVSEQLSRVAKGRYSKCEEVFLTLEQYKSLSKDQKGWINGKTYTIIKTDPITNDEFVVEATHINQKCATAKDSRKIQAKNSKETRQEQARKRYLEIEEFVRKTIFDKHDIPTLSKFKENNFNIRMKLKGKTILNIKDFYDYFLYNIGANFSINSFLLKNVEYRQEIANKALNLESFSYNHKIINIQKDCIEDVYCLTVVDTHKVCVITSTKNTKDDRKKYNLIPASNCGEQTLDNKELCTLVETFPAKHETLEDYKRTLKFAYLYAKTVTLGKTHWPETNKALLKNRRIGCSMSGIAQFITKHGLDELKKWCQEGYATIQHWDVIYSDWLVIRNSKKISSIKPSGCLFPNTTIRTNTGNKSLHDIFLQNGINLSTKTNEHREWYDIKKETIVYDKNGHEKNITKLFINGIEETIKFELEDGSFIECTPNHMFLMTNGEWKKAKDINLNDDFKTL